MKQVKFLLVVLMAVVMGVSVTSCMKGDENTTYVAPTFAKLIDIIPPTFQQANGQKLVVNDMSLSTLNTGEIYFFYFQFDTAVQDPSSPSLNVTLPSGLVSVSAKSSEGPIASSDATKANAPLYIFKEPFYLFASVPVNGEPFMFGTDVLIIPITYWVKVESTEDKQKEELEKHSFIVTFDRTEIEQGSTELKLALNHVINDGENKDVVRDKYTSTCKAYSLTNAMYEFQSVAGKKPTKITVKVKTNSSKNSLEGAIDKQWEYTIRE